MVGLECPLTKSIDNIIRSFLTNLTGRESRPKYAILIAQTSVGMCGLAILYPSHRAAPDFTIHMTASIKCATNSVRLNKDLEPFQFCPLNAALYSHELNLAQSQLHLPVPI